MQRCLFKLECYCYKYYLREATQFSYCALCIIALGCFSNVILYGILINNWCSVKHAESIYTMICLWMKRLMTVTTGFIVSCGVYGLDSGLPAGANS